VRCLATVTDEEDAVDVADPRRVNTRIYRCWIRDIPASEYDECATAGAVIRAE
jgi:hypothetical protein